MQLNVIAILRNLLCSGYQVRIVELEGEVDGLKASIASKNKQISRLTRQLSKIPRVKFTSATTFIKWLCKFYDKPYPIITVSEQRVAEINAKQPNMQGVGFFLMGPSYEESEIVLMFEDIVVDNNAMTALIEAGHHIKDFHHHMDRQPTVSEL